ncbi:MAG TPA: Ppx/GppA phosphatase family protein [Myxococcaceae bacterium]|nr:Ppx/GppA phosphatase family protein [Myxococcaceae bacterium]
MTRPVQEPVLAAIDVGTNAVRLELARLLANGSLELLHQERDPVRPGEGVFRSGVIPREVAERLLSTLRRYGALCRRYHAQVRAVATSALREARNRDEIVRRAREEAGLRLEVISGMEEARLITLGVLWGKPQSARSLCIDIGGGSTEVASAMGDSPNAMWSVGLGAVRLTELFGTSRSMSNKQLKLMRGYVSEALTEGLPARIAGAPRSALGSSGTIGAVVGYAAAAGTAHATARQISEAVEDLVEMSPAQRRKRFDARRAEVICAGAVILEQLVKHLGLDSVTAVQRGLREGILVDLIRRRAAGEDHSLHEAALVLGRRLHFDEAHAAQVTRLGLQLFDDLAPLHRLPASARPLLEVAGLLHDIGNAVSYQKHHRHSYYLIVNAEIPGLRERERELVARIARYHRRSPPDPSHSGMEGLGPGEIRLVRKLATLLRVADSLDRSHRQSIVRLQARLLPNAVVVKLKARNPLDLELWDATHEAALFRRVFGRKLHLQVLRQPRELHRKAMRAAAYLAIDPRFR